MQLPKKRTMHHKRTKRQDTMNLENRRLREIQKEKTFFKQLLDNSESISDCLTYQGKIDLLSKEEAEILEKHDVII